VVGIDNIPVGVLKTGVNVLAAPLAHLCNIFSATGVFPSGLKAGKISSPVYKGGTSPGMTRCCIGWSLSSPRCIRTSRSL
jgi:hypothetical protein